MEWNWPEPTRQSVCVVDGEVTEGGLLRAFGVPRIVSRSQMPSIELFTLLKFVLIDLIVTMPWFTLGVRNYVTSFSFLQDPTIKRFWTLF